MKIKWCSEIFLKPESSKCWSCDVLNDTNGEKYCYGIFYIFHKIAQIRFFFIGLFRAIRNRIKNNIELYNCIECNKFIGKNRKCPHCGYDIDNIPF